MVAGQQLLGAGAGRTRLLPSRATRNLERTCGGTLRWLSDLVCAVCCTDVSLSLPHGIGTLRISNTALTESRVCSRGWLRCGKDQLRDGHREQPKRPCQRSRG